MRGGILDFKAEIFHRFEKVSCEEGDYNRPLSVREWVKNFDPYLQNVFEHFPMRDAKKKENAKLL